PACVSSGAVEPPCWASKAAITCTGSSMLWSRPTASDCASASACWKREVSLSIRIGLSPRRFWRTGRHCPLRCGWRLPIQADTPTRMRQDFRWRAGFALEERASRSQPDQAGKAPAARALAPVRIEPRIGERVEAATMHPRDTRRGQPLPRQRGEVAVPMPRPRRREAGGGAGRMAYEGGAHFLADFVGRPGYARSQPCQQARWRHLHLFDGGFEHAGGEATPAGVGGGYGAAVVGAEQHRQAVGGEDREHGAGDARDRGVGLRLVLAWQRTQLGHGAAVYLVQ